MGVASIRDPQLGRSRLHHEQSLDPGAHVGPHAAHIHESLLRELPSPPLGFLRLGLSVLGYEGPRLPFRLGALERAEWSPRAHGGAAAHEKPRRGIHRRAALRGPPEPRRGGRLDLESQGASVVDLRVPHRLRVPARAERPIAACGALRSLGLLLHAGSALEGERRCSAGLPGARGLRAAGPLPSREAPVLVADPMDQAAVRRRGRGAPVRQLARADSKRRPFTHTRF